MVHKIQDSWHIIIVHSWLFHRLIESFFVVAMIETRLQGQLSVTSSPRQPIWRNFRLMTPVEYRRFVSLQMIDS